MVIFSYQGSLHLNLAHLTCIFYGIPGLGFGGRLTNDLLNPVDGAFPLLLLTYTYGKNS